MLKERDIILKNNVETSNLSVKQKSSTTLLNAVYPHIYKELSGKNIFKRHYVQLGIFAIYKGDS